MSQHLAFIAFSFGGATILALDGWRLQVPKWVILAEVAALIAFGFFAIRFF